MADLRIKPASQHWKGALHPPREWQQEALPLALEALQQGVAGLIHAVMGSGKSALIAEVCAQVQLSRRDVIVISTPTMALVEQLSETLEARLGGRVGRWYGPRQELAPVVVACNPSLPTLAEALPRHGRRCAAWIVDEAHGSECATLLGAAEELGERVPRLGLTATPFRANEEESLSLWDELLYSYGPVEALADGVVVPFIVEPWRGGESTIDDACASMIEQAVRQGWAPLVVDADSIQDAELFAERLRIEEGVRAEAVHSGMGRREVKDAIERLVKGELDALVHVALLKEGVNIPELRALCLRREVKSPVWMMQHIGRVLRASPGKERALILDPGGQLRRIGLHHEAVLGGETLGDEAWEEVEEELEEESAPLQLQEELEASEDEAEEACPRMAVVVPEAAIDALYHCMRLEQAGLLRRTKVPGRCCFSIEASLAWKASLRHKIEAALPRIQVERVPQDIRRSLRAALTAWAGLDEYLATDVFDLVYLCLRPDLRAELSHLPDLHGGVR